MKIVINNHRKIFAIQAEFSKLFPALKLGFYAKPNNPKAAPSDKLILHSNHTLQDCRAVSKQGIMEMLPTMSITDLKNNFRDIFGLSVDIFQKAGQAADAITGSAFRNLAEVNKQYIVN